MIRIWFDNEYTKSTNQERQIPSLSTYKSTTFTIKEILLVFEIYIHHFHKCWKKVKFWIFYCKSNELKTDTLIQHTSEFQWHHEINVQATWVFVLNLYGWKRSFIQLFIWHDCQFGLSTTWLCSVVENNKFHDI